MRVYNFSAGPSMLPLEVLERVQKNLVDYKGCGMSVMEMSHRGKEYQEINSEASSLLKELLSIPDDYDIIFVQGGASTQFEALPLNFNNCKADYVVTGNFAKKSFKEAQKYGDIVCAASSEDKNFTYIPKTNADMFRNDLSYVHICYNNTIFGTHYNSIPDVGNNLLVADMSSCILSEEVDVSKFGVIYAGAQKNVGPAGTTIVIAKKGVSGNEQSICPTMLKWSTQIKENSLYNTPPCFSTYVAMEVFKYIKEFGGVKAMNEQNVYKAGLLYDYIDNSSFYSSSVVKEDRSIMNIPFITPNADLDSAFVSQAKDNGFVSLKGHRLVGGMRASIYNAMPVEGVKSLVEFMKKFEKENK